MSGTISAAVCCGAILLAMAIGYLAGTRRRPPRHGSMQTAGTAAPPLAHYRWRTLWVPETAHAPRDLLVRRQREPGMIRRWRCG
jgi:hypothetical protein